VSARVDVLGVGFDRVDLAAAVERTLRRLDAGERTFVITANPEFVMLARRDESLALLRTLTPEQWKRAGVHATRGPVTINDFVTLMAWHDDNHLDQLKRALEGKA